MRVEYDASANMAYIYLIDKINPGEAVQQVPVGEDTTAVLDYDSQGRLLGIELFNARSRLHPDLLAIAESIDGQARPPAPQPRRQTLDTSSPTTSLETGHG
ncbi:DUF2283 domain-containing protein [Streptomyces sp. NPDC059193]|uniref:DUF2283 domain-containing protein n=1 Tax=Streptomyces sp. NPDC059193 TaxID=3346763 RepID=UPI0036A2A678